MDEISLMESTLKKLKPLMVNSKIILDRVQYLYYLNSSVECLQLQAVHDNKSGPYSSGMGLMIKLSRLTDYAVVILAAMSGREGALVSASALAEETTLPEPTVSKVLKLLAKGGIIASVRGASGGYVLKGRASEIRISAVIAAMEGPIALTACVSGSTDNCAIEKFCLLQGRWNVVNSAIKTALDQVTLADMLPYRQGRFGHEEKEGMSVYE